MRILFRHTKNPADKKTTWNEIFHIGSMFRSSIDGELWLYHYHTKGYEEPFRKIPDGFAVSVFGEDER